MNTKIFPILAPFLLLLIVGVVILWMIGSVGSEKLAIYGGTITIENGMTAHGLHEKLKLDSPEWLYKIWMKKNYPDFTLAAGSYPARGDVTVDQLFSEVLLYEPQADDIQITILPGWHLREIENHLLARLGTQTDISLVDSDEELTADLRGEYPFLGFATSLEGFLYPDTYRIYPDATLRDIVEVMLTRFDEEIFSEFPQGEVSLGFYDTLKLASIVEEEEKDPDNKSIVAGILKKRLDEGWQLGTDVTVCYQDLILGDECQRYVNTYYSLSQLQKAAQQNEYDTRRWLGLPPTPVSSVSKQTFSAVVEHRDSAYYYYLHDSDGTIRYGRDAAEHDANKQEYLY